MQKVLVAGAGGFIGGHLVKTLHSSGVRVVAVDIKPLEQWYQLFPDVQNYVLDLSNEKNCLDVTQDINEIYNLACDMGGMGFIENNKSLCMLSVLINTNLLKASLINGIKDYFFASSACVYPTFQQEHANVTALKESDAYPANPEDGYGWEKLFSERMCQNFGEDFGIRMRIARLHNVYGPNGTYQGGREKAPAALIRKVLEAVRDNTEEIEIWGDGEQTRSFMYIDDCIEGILRLRATNFYQPINIGREDLISINNLLSIIEEIAGVTLQRNYKLDAPLGVRGRNSDNTLIRQTLSWEPAIPLSKGMEKTYYWIREQMEKQQAAIQIASPDSGSQNFISTAVRHNIL